MFIALQAEHGATPWFWLAEQLEQERYGRVLVRWLKSTTDEPAGPYKYEGYYGNSNYSQYVEATTMLNVDVTLDQNGYLAKSTLENLHLLRVSANQELEAGTEHQLAPTVV